MKTEFSLECQICGAYNLQNGMIIKGKILCWDCYMNKITKEIGIKRKGAKNVNNN